MKCRHCHAELEHIFLDLGYAPPSNAYLTSAQLQTPELTFPLKLYICDQCWLVQTEDYAQVDDLFAPDYAYFSSTSQGWLKHASVYATMITQRLELNSSSFVVEVASNDGYLLKNFISAGIPCLGIEPTDSTASAAEALGIPVLRNFFGVDIAQKLVTEDQQADLICGNNVYAHVPNINDFTQGLKILLKPNGTINLEFPHLLQLIKHNQFDTVYHEHFSYLSLSTVCRIFRQSGLRVYDVEELPTHGGSLRVYGCHENDDRHCETIVKNLLDQETEFGLLDLKIYKQFQQRANQVKNDFLSFLIDQKKAGKTVAAYGAAAKGNTLMNYAGVKPDLISFVCDAAPSKQGKYTPGSHIPILPPSELFHRKPDWVVIFPWNIAEEVMQQQLIQDWGGKFIVAVPRLTILS